MFNNFFNVHFSLFLLVKVITFCKGLQTCDFNVTVTLQRLFKNNGFHREIYSEYDFMIGKELKTLYILSIEHLSSDVYVDPFELNRLSSFGGPFVLLLDKINIESPAYEAQPIDAFVFLETTNLSSKAVLPIHLRYQKAHNCSKFDCYVKVKLKSPTILVRFDDIDVDHCEYAIKAPCDMSRKKCSWIPVTILSDTPELFFDIPVGCTEHEAVVTIITYLVIAFGALVLIYTLLQKSYDSKKLQ